MASSPPQTWGSSRRTSARAGPDGGICEAAHRCRANLAAVILPDTPAESAAMSSVLVLNQNYEPLNVCHPRRAFVLVERGKAEVLEHGSGALRSATRSFPLPS